MKKFAKILGFLGFFVTLATGQIGSVWAAPERVECDPGYYLPAEGPGVEITGPESCVECEGKIVVDGVQEGVYCMGGVFEAPYNRVQGRELCASGKCAPMGNHWTLTESGASSPLECKDECSKRCITPDLPDPNCPWPNGCEYDRGATAEGTIMCNQSCVAEPTATNYYCPISCPDTCEGRCKCPIDNTTSGDCPGYDTSVYFSGVLLCGASSCDVSQNIYGNPTQNNGYCPSSDECIVDCVPGDCPDGAYCEWDYNSNSQMGNWYQNGGNKICVDQNGNEIIPETCDMLHIKCKEPCEYWDDNQKECVAYQSSTTYKCGVNSSITASGTAAICGQSYTVNRAADGETLVLDPNTQNCAPNGQTFAGWWKLNTSYTPYNNREYSDGETTTWGAATNESMTFIAMWDSSCYEIVFDDETHGGETNTNGGPIAPQKLYKRFKDDQYTWYTDEKCETKITISDLNAAMAQHLPSKSHATFDGYFYENENPNLQIFDDEDHDGALTSTGESWMIDEHTTIVNGAVKLYAQYTCLEGYHLNHNQCVGNAIDVKYTCYSPVDPATSASYTYEDAAIYGIDYEVESVENVVAAAAANNQQVCQFTGYQLVNNNYQWGLEQYSGHTYGPGDSMDDWQYLSPQPPALTEIEFTLKSDAWEPIKYSVKYYCGSISGHTFASPGYVTDNEVVYNDNYTVANSNVLSDFNSLCVPADGWTLQYWTFTCLNYPDDPTHYASGANFGQWTYPTNDCYFTANWAQTDFVIILDQNGGGGDDISNYLYTRNSGPTKGVYRDAERQQLMKPFGAESPNPVVSPQKTIDIALYPGGNGASFTYNGTTYPNGNASYASLSPSLDFNGYYQNTISNPVQYIEPHSSKGYITTDGIDAGISYDENSTEAERTWVAHWGTYSLALPEPQWAGHVFDGWYTCDPDDPMGEFIEVFFGYSGSYTISQDITLCAHWTESCYEIEFDDETNHGESTGNPAGNTYYKKYNDNRWYSNNTCTTPATLTDGNGHTTLNLPEKDNAHFTGYFDAPATTDTQVFDGDGLLTIAGISWTVTDNATLYAQYECDFPYHLDTDPESNTYGQCVTCDTGEFYQNGQCQTCNQILQPITGINGWTSRAPYNWDIKQCYRVCNKPTDTQTECADVDLISGHPEMEQFLGDCTGCTPTGKQISFYGNEYAGINTCNSDTGATKCPQGFLNSNGNSNQQQHALKLMTAAVDFYQKSDINGAYEYKGTRYILGDRHAGTAEIELNNGFAWSQVVGDAQKTTNLYTVIIYPAVEAPSVSNLAHHTFSGYGYPEDGSGIIPIDSDRVLTTGTSGNAAGIISYAINLDPANNNMSPIINQNRNLYAQYTADPTYTLTYSCGDGDTGNPPSPQSGIYTGDTVNISTPSSCSHYSTNSLTGWAVTATEGGQNLGTVAAGIPSFSWEYTQNVTFTAQWGSANTQRIIYNKIPDPAQLSQSGNTLVRPDASTMPTQFECGDGQTSTISGAPQLQNSNGEPIGEVVAWCDDNGVLSNCVLPKTVQHTPCADKNVYAKWECTDPRYHLNENEDDCVLCPGGDYWDPNANGGNGACVPCSQLGSGWTSIAGYNWGADQCYRFCPSGKTCAVFNESTYGDFNIANVVQYNTTQIEFYGNHYTHSEIPDVCASDSDVKYCPKLLSGSTAGALKPMSSPVTFMKKGNTATAGTRHIIGNRDASHLTSPYYLTSSSGKIWSHIVGPGQYTGTSNEPNYTFIIYPTDAAPAPSDNANDPLFKGYYDAQTGGTQRVVAALGLDSNNAIAFAQTPLSLNQIGDRILYPQYCENGQEWNGSVCIGTDYTVKYICGPHGMDVDGMSMENTATYGQSYKVAYQTPSSNQQIAACNPDTGYVLKTNDNNEPVWKFNGNDENHYTGEVINQWNFTIQSPKFTAQYDCAAGYTANGDVNDGGNCVLGVFTVTYDCGIGTGNSAPDSEHQVSTNGTYNVLPNGTANGGVVDCNLAGQGFAGWKFSENTGVNTYNAGNTITWLAGYGNETLTAQYRLCSSNEVLVDGVCYPKCEDKTCTEPTPQNLQSHCPTDHTPPYPHNDVTCSYSYETITNGYNNGDGYCRYSTSGNGHNVGDIINEGTCIENVVCNDSNYIWNGEACEPNTGITYTVQFKCYETDPAPISGYSFSVTYGQSITVPLDSACQRTGYSYSQWRATQYNNPATLPAGASTSQYTWNQTHGETFIADWNDGNVYHVNLHAYSCDDSSQTGTFGSSGVQNLWEKYGVNWYRTNVGGTLSNPITELTAQQLPTRNGWTFGGYNNLAGDARVRNIGGIWSVSPATLIQNDEDWCAIWSQCNPNEYWNSGVCVSCNVATNGDYPLGDAGATNIYQCYKQCSICTPVCPQTEGVDYCEFGNNPNMNGNLYYPGTGTCQPNYEQNCPITVLHCLPGYTPNGNNTACVPNNYMITLNSHIDGFNGHASSPEVLYTKYGPNGGAYLDSAYAYLMNDERSLYDVPVKSADVILNGNGGNVIWNGYSSSTATLTATFDFQGFYPSVYGGNQYISDTGYITDNGNTAAQQNQSNSTVWHAQWQDGSITLPNAQRQCYTFNGWWTDVYNGVSAGNANMPYTPTGATTNLYAHWTPGTYSITYHNGNAIYSGCSTTSYTFGNAFDINCSITPQAGSHKVFKGWCTNPELTAGCTQNPVISNTDCGDKDYYAWWGCESGYNLENGVCVPNASELCPATLPTNANLNMSYSLNPTPNADTCTYHLQCASCIGSNDHDCYTRDGMNFDGTFTVTGPVGNSTVLNNVRCEPATYNAVYKCGAGTPGDSYTDGVTITYNGSYTVLPNGTENGGVVTCSKDGERFNHWTFNLESGRQYTGGDQIRPWLYHGQTVPTFTAQYGPCPEGEVPVDGECKTMCIKDCTYPGANPGACPSDYPANAICTYDTSSNQVIGYRPSPYSNKCLDVDYPHDPVVSEQCDVTDVICPTHYQWNSATLKCDPVVYYVTLDANGGTTGAGFISKLFEQYNVGWGINETGSFVQPFQLAAYQLPTSPDISQVFTGYGINCNSNTRMISADGLVIASPTTLVGNDQTWYACYGPNTDATFTIKFRCTANGQDIYVQNVHVGESINVPATGVCPGVAFNQWKGTLIQPVIMLNAGTSTTWNNYADEIFVPDVKAVYHVDLNANGGTFPSDDYQELWYAVDLGWYKNAGLTTQITYIPSDSLPTKQGSNFNGWLDSTTQAQRGNFSGANWALPASISANETWDAQWGPCAAGQYWDNGVCRSCSEATGGTYPLADANATNVNQCYKICSICLRNGCPTVHVANCGYNPDDPSVQNNGKEYNNGTQTCVSNTNPTPNCPYMITDCDPGWVPAPDGQNCVEDEKHTITLESHIIHGVSSDPDVLYTWHNRGVYLYSNYTGEMTTTQNPLSENPLNYAIVTFNLNGQGASLIWNGQTYTGTMNANVLFDYQGFWKSVNGSPRYIDVDGHINGSGIAAGAGYTDDTTWHARWQSRTLGTISSSGNDLPVPTRPGFVFDGWYDLPMGGNQVYSSSLVNNDMTVYAHWSDVIYEVKLVSDRNNCQPSNNTPTKLYEKYNVGWNRYTTGTFELNLNLNDDELPTPNAGYEFKGYYDALSGGDRVIRPDGRVEQEPNYTDNTHTWYARCGRPTGPFTITFRCGAGEDPLPNYTQSVQNGGTVRVPPTSACSNAGYTFTSWMGDHNTTFTARDTEYMATWSDVYANEDFTPNWNNGNVYYVTLAQTDATEPGIEILYEKYDNGWGYTANGPFNVTGLSGSQLPRRSGYVFAGYKYNDVQMGYVSNGQWRLPDPTVLTDNNQVWEPDWSQCAQGEYWDGNKCYPCPDGFTDNPHAIGAEQCYGNCEYDCQDSGCPSTLPVGMQSCAPNHSDYPQWGIKYNRPGATCLPQGQQSLPICPNDIICNNGYDLVGTECRDNRYTIALNSNLYNDNGTLANPSTLYTWFNHGVYRDYNRTYMMTPNDYPLESGTPSTYATVTLNGNGAMFNWHDMYGGQLSDNVDFVFDGFYDTTGAEIDPVIGINRYITGAGQSIGTTAQNNQTWQARWLNGSVDLPGEDIMSRDGYTFAGWWNACDGGALVSTGNQTIAVSGDRTLCAHWSGKSYTVTYNCNSEDGQGGSATDNQLAYQNTSYTVRENFIPCSKPATETTRAHEFENWKFNLNSNTYWPGDSILWIFTDDNPTFNAHYKECPDGSYFDGSCKICPTGYDHSDIVATGENNCFRNCPIECNHVCPNEDGVLACTNYTDTPSNGTQYYGNSECVGEAQDCKYYTIMCKPGYTPDYYLSTDVGVHCTKLADHEITLDANCGGNVTPGQEKLYTTENMGVYLNPARTNQYQMSTYEHPLSVDDLPKCVVTATFNYCNNDDPNCNDATTTNRGVNLTFNGYYKMASGTTQYTDARSVDGQLKSYITAGGMDAGKGYTEDATWYAHWNASQVGTDKWPTAPTRPGRCNITAYEFSGWWTEPQNGTPVYPETTISENVTWYAHWCESCTGSIEHGSCSVNNCTATIACDSGYMLSADGCSCSAATDLTLTYRPNGGTPDQEYTYSMTFGDTFTPLPGTTYTMENNRIAYWKRVTTNCSNLPQEFDFDESYTYNCNGATNLDAEWRECHCSYTVDSGVASCETFVDNNLCKTRFECKPGYVPMPLSECGGQYLTECGVNCTICPAGTYQDNDECKPCEGESISAAGATQCTPCDLGSHANSAHTQCEPNTITIAWDENGGNEIDDGSCVYGQTFTLANAPTHNNNSMQFQGWKLANNEIKSAGASVMCNIANVGVDHGTSTVIQAQWNQCQCIEPFNPHVTSCYAWFVDGECKYVSLCENGYEVDPLTAYTPAAVCNPITSNITYNCGEGATGAPVTATDTAEYGTNYTVKNEGGANCQKTGFNFAGWLLSADNQTYQPGYTFRPWSFANTNVTFTAQYSQCAAGEIWVNGTCEPCTCSQNNWSSGVASCVASPSSISACSAVVTCETGYNNPQGSCDGATCSAQCDQIQSNAIYVCGNGATGTPPATETMNYGATHTVKTKANCSKSGHTFNGWHFTGTNGDYNAGATIPWNYGTDQTFTGQWCENCGNVMNGSCSLDESVAGSCSYTCSCEPGYELDSDVCNAHPICNPSNYNVIYQPNGGMNNGVLGQQVVQNVTYGVGFTTKDGTIFTKPNNIVTAWDRVDGGDYPELNHSYTYNTAGDTWLDAHWESCECTQDNGVASCTTSSTNMNTCSCTGECAPGYVYGGCNCDGTACTPICNKKKSDAIYECGDGATGTPPATETMEYGATHTVKPKENCSKTNHTFMTWLFSGDSNYHNPDDTIAWNYTENKTFTGQWCENCVQPSNGSCELGAGFAGSCQYTCSCEPGYKLVGDCNAYPVCEPDNTLAIHYKSNNGLNQTYNQPVTYGQPFVTEGGTRFTKVNHIMTQWKVENNATTTTFPTGIAGLSGDYVYGDTTDTTLEAQWEQCTCDADGCTTYATNSNECACNASEESCPDGYIYGGCECNGTNCAPICTLSQSNAIYNCGTGTGIPPVSELVSYGTPYTIKANATVYGCSRENSTFAGWEFDGDQQIHAAGDTVTWNYTTDKNFRAVYCNNCLPEDHCTLDIPNPGECVVTCHTGYEWDSNLKKCVAKTYPGDEGITYKPNGGTPNRNYTQTVTYDASFTTLDWSAEHYRKPRHIMTQWVVESGGAGTFNGGYAALGTEYTYKTDGATVLAADWTECAADKISLNNQCQQCNCTAGTGTTSCGTLSTDDDTCAWGPVSCLTGYVNPTLDCSDDTTNCTAYCTKCGNKQVEVNGACTDCECEINGDGVNSGCGFVSNNGNICNWNPTTCELGYGNPQLTCTETDYNYDCEASCTICEAGFYGDDGVECKPCPDGKTSLPGAKSKKECFIDPNSCEPDEHIEHGECVSNTRACSIPNATSAARIWNPAIGTYGPCTVIECDAANGYHESGNACVRDTCTVAHGSAESEYIGGQWECFVTKCDPGYEPSSDDKSCVECANRYVDGDPNKDVAVSSYVSECEIAACMYQGQKYALQNGECVPICESETDETGTKVWDERTKKCVRTCKPGYKMW